MKQQLVNLSTALTLVAGLEVVGFITHTPTAYLSNDKNSLSQDFDETAVNQPAMIVPACIITSDGYIHQGNNPEGIDDPKSIIFYDERCTETSRTVLKGNNPDHYFILG